MNRLYLIAALAVCLCISLGINFAQFVTGRVAAARAPLVAQVASMERTAAISHAVAAARSIDDAELARLRKLVGTRETQTLTVYRDRVRQLPAPACAPGHARVEAWNAIATPEKP